MSVFIITKSKSVYMKMVIKKILEVILYFYRMSLRSNRQTLMDIYLHFPMMFSHYKLHPSEPFENVQLQHRKNNAFLGNPNTNL